MSRISKPQKMESADTNDLEADIFNGLYESIGDDNEYTIAYCRWFSKMIALFPNVPDELHIIHYKHRDDGLNDAVCYAAYKSITDVIGELHQPNSNLYFSVKKLINSLCERVLTSFDSRCKDLSVETCAEAVQLKDTIQVAANLAIDYIRRDRYENQLPDERIDFFDLHLSSFLQENLRGKSIEEDIKTKRTTLDDDLVGIESDLKEIKEQLVGSYSSLQIVPIVGMGGIGKTTLTRRVYEDPQIVLHFHVRAWVVVSLEYRERDVLLGLLESIAPLAKEVLEEDNGDLAQRLCKRLKGQRYLIVIDDIWTSKAWDDMKLCFPDDRNGSCIVLTSRIVELASYINLDGPVHFMKFLDLEDSWNLLCKQVFGKEVCPPDQLVNVGMQIAEKCKGLPLAVKVLAGHLSSISQTKDSWKNVADTVSLSTELTRIDSVINILSLSYNNLPRHLKACFLSLLIYPKNYEIQVRELIWLWTSMGFLYPNLENNEEEVAKSCLESLISRNLIMVRKRKFDGKVRSCAIHDLLWDLGMREARKDGESIFGQSPLSHPYFHTGDDSKYVMGLTHTLLYFDKSFESDCCISAAGFKFLRTLKIINQSFYSFPNEIANLINLRHLWLITCSDVPDSVAKFRNLEILMIINEEEKVGSSLPKEIWLLRRLRHLLIKDFTCVPDPPRAEIEGSRVSVLSDLQTLDSISSASCTKEVLLNIPNLKELGIHETRNDSTGDEILNCLSNLILLDKLQKLKLCCKVEVGKPRHIPQWKSFVPNIKHLILIGSHLTWKEINTLTMLPNLEVLKLRTDAAVGPEWEMDEVFFQLKYLLLESLDLNVWKLNADQLPNLQRLVIRLCILRDLPILLGEIPTLQLIDLDLCSSACYKDAMGIYEAQQEVGNDKFTINVGRALPQLQILSLGPIFVYMAWLLKMNRDRSKTKCILAWSLLLITCGGVLWFHWRGR